jgi:hypothetical protein
MDQPWQGAFGVLSVTRIADRFGYGHRARPLSITVANAKGC